MSIRYALTILLLLTPFTYPQTTQDHSQDICRDHNAYPTPTPIPATGLTVTNSTDCVKVFSVDLTNPAYANMNVLIQFTITSYPSGVDGLAYTPYLIGKKGFTPGFDDPSSTTTTENNPTAQDYTGFIQRSSLQYIEIDATVSNGTGTYYLAFYKFSDINQPYYAGPVSYTISVQAGLNYVCPNDCTNSNQGTCDIIFQQCDCQTGFLGRDCSIQPSQLQVPQVSAPLTLPANTWSYFFIPIQSWGGSFAFNFTIISSTVAYSYEIIANGQNTLPSVNINEGDYTTYILNSSNSVFSRNYSQASIDGLAGENFVFALKNLELVAPATVMFQSAVADPPPASSQSSSSSSSNNSSGSTNSGAVAFAVIAPIVIFIIILGVSLGVISDRQARARREALRRQHQMNLAGLAGPPPPPPAAMDGRQDHVVPQLLAAEQVDQYFPKKNYPEIYNKFQSNCTICLEDFESDNECRQLYCGHVFHDDCIRQWLKKHDKCPNCNSLMTVAAITTFKNSTKQQQDAFHLRIARISSGMPAQIPGDRQGNISQNSVNQLEIIPPFYPNNNNQNNDLSPNNISQHNRSLNIYNRSQNPNIHNRSPNITSRSHNQYAGHYSQGQNRARNSNNNGFNLSQDNIPQHQIPIHNTYIMSRFNPAMNIEPVLDFEQQDARGSIENSQIIRDHTIDLDHIEDNRQDQPQSQHDQNHSLNHSDFLPVNINQVGV